MLALARSVVADDRSIKSGGWQTNLAVGLAGKVLGVCGLGRLGSAAARVGILAFGMKVVAWSENLTQEKADKVVKEMGLPVEDEHGEKTFKVVTKDQLFQQADVLTVHYVLSPRSVGIIGKRELELMKSTSILVNSSRGPLIDEVALFDVLEKGGRIRGFAVDVYDVEPLPATSRWRSKEWGRAGRSQVLTTPHTGFVDEIVQTWYDESAENVERWMKGMEVNNRLA